MLAAVARALALASLALLADAERYVFAFGDSYSSTEFHPHGGTPSLKNPIGNPKLPGWTTAHGAGNIASMLALAPSSTFVYNMAVIGAPVNNTETPTMSPDFSQQTDTLLDLLKEKPSPANWTAETTVLTAYFGTNDISMTYLKNAQHPEKTVRIIEAIYQVFGKMYRHGVRQFLAVGMDPMYRAPVYAAHPVPGLVHRVQIENDIAQWNGLLYEGSLAFEKSHPGSVVRVLDTIPIFDRILDHPKAHGAKNNYCFHTDGKQCMWTDDLHPGHALQHGIGQGLYDSLFSMGFFPTHR